jgi:hypothetical protein
MYHAVIRQVGGGFVLYDAGSDGGTYVNRQRIRGQYLSDADVLTLGDERIVFSSALWVPTTSRDPGSTILQGTSRLVPKEGWSIPGFAGGPGQALTGPTQLGSLDLLSRTVLARRTASRQVPSRTARRVVPAASTANLPLTAFSRFVQAQSAAAQPPLSRPGPWSISSIKFAAGTGDASLDVFSRLLAERAGSRGLPRPKALEPANLELFLRRRLDSKGTLRKS